MPPIDNLPNEMIVPGRDDIRDRYLRDYRLRNPSAQTIEGSQPWIDASVMADTMVPVFANAKALGEYAAGQNRSGPALDEDARRLGTRRLPAIGGLGYLLIKGASVGGGTIFAGDIATADNNGGLRYQCLLTGLYAEGSYVPVQGVDTGPATNLPAGTILTWQAPRPGIPPQNAVAAQSNGDGLSGGRNVESDQDLDARLIQLRANPPVAGNDAQIQAAVLQTPAVFPQQAFTYPAIGGPGTTTVAFTMRPSQPGASRVPSAAQIALVQAWLAGQFPADFSITVSSLIASPVAVSEVVDWAFGVATWTDATPWPVSSILATVAASPTPTPTSFTLDYLGTGLVNPQVGQSIAFYDPVAGVFRRKRILTVSGSNPWAVTVDTTNNASDVSYAPAAGQLASPWSDSLASIVPAIVAYFDGLGPGEQVGSFFDPGLRQRRSPRSPAAWPSVVTKKLESVQDDVSTVDSTTLLAPSVPYATPTGTAGVSSNLLTIGDLAAFAS